MMASPLDQPIETQTVYVIDDEPAVLRSLETLLNHKGFATKCYENPDQFLQEFDAGKPGCLLVDLHLPSMSGIALVHRVRAMGSLSPAIMFSGSGTIAEVAQSMRDGAIDFLEKPVETDVLCNRIREAFEKDTSLRDEQTRFGELRDRLSSLSPRERQVAALVIDGMTAKEIAAQLGIETKTVEVHRSRLVRKAGFESTLEFVRDLACYGIRTSQSFRELVATIKKR